jgi:hypothetical protein
VTRLRFERPAELPPWLAALAMVGAVLLTISLLPTLASALTPDAAGKAASSIENLSLDGESPAGETSAPKHAADCAHGGSKATPSRTRTPTPTPAEKSLREKAADTAKTYGVDPSKLIDQHAAVRAALDAKKSCTRPLPHSGGNANGILLAAVLLAAGLTLLLTIGFKTDRPWPGRYVRRVR